MNTTIRPGAAVLAPATSGFVLSAAIIVVLNTALAWAKDASPALNEFMKRIGGHHWTTHGVVDLLFFIALGFTFTKTRAAEKIPPNRLTTVLIAAVAIAGLGLALWYLFV
jgi:hypothetical protein